ncbi:hypothetical protein B0H65DRAFT_461563 [Neurospora tetraspora]|uniref:Uncharacterized protein n=1 Tax=Neurospora tetraspora TaxID=94610 RepID=A0AAE0MTH1_9PEZI|nr:hypothetical protein B0H65DRAFT_461563 [Neurospora tetraspora]
MNIKRGNLCRSTFTCHMRICYHHVLSLPTTTIIIPLRRLPHCVHHFICLLISLRRPIDPVRVHEPSRSSPRLGIFVVGHRTRAALLTVLATVLILIRVGGGASAVLESVFVLDLVVCFGITAIIISVLLFNVLFFLVSAVVIIIRIVIIFYVVATVVIIPVVVRHCGAALVEGCER